MARPVGSKNKPKTKKDPAKKGTGKVGRPAKKAPAKKAPAKKGTGKVGRPAVGRGKGKKLGSMTQAHKDAISKALQKSPKAKAAAVKRGKAMQGKKRTTSAGSRGRKASVAKRGMSRTSKARAAAARSTSKKK